jgi:DNA-binding MarR family transcriptional regulator
MPRPAPRARDDEEAAFARDLAGRPGFLVRRLHQIHLALFAEECGRFGVTPVQYSVLTVVGVRPGLEQARLAHEVGVDRTTLANVLARLERRGLVRRSVPDGGDRRTKQVFPTPQGRGLLDRMDAAARRAHERTVEALAPEERAVFLAQLRTLVDAGNEHGRAPLRLL